NDKRGNNKMNIAVDASGGDYAPHEIVKGAIKAAHEYEIEITLVGRKEILTVLAGRYLTKLGMNIVEADEIISFNESPIDGIRSKPNSSIVVGTKLVKEGIASAFVSAGSTGAVFAAALMLLGKIPGVERPAIGCLINVNAAAPILLIDAGANTECRPQHLVHFAQLGTIYFREIFGIPTPTVGLLNNGEEEHKGNKLTQETYQLLKASKLNFAGNIEGQDIAAGKTNIVVTDGFTGNIVLKTIEGMSTSWLYSLSQSGRLFSKAHRLPSESVHRDIGIDSWSKRLDYREYGGSSLLGVNGDIIIAHGRSQAKAIKNAIGLAKQAVESNVCQKLKEEHYEQTNASG
ncbi:MAG TPA: phosphate acyltransferase PlsX, partial [Dehalococcoidales bacterium]|nr:phosphate acyltransferase PlsX [Dehalococcoidales bacterium]